MYHDRVKAAYFFGGKAVAEDLFPTPPYRVVVACSGGLDSVYALHALWACREALGLELAVLTCDHGLRPESGADAEWVRHLAWGLGLPCFVERFDLGAAREKGESLEMCARRVRREAYFRTAEGWGADTVALGHHQDDQAETVLMRLCRGTGTGGASGMAPVRTEKGLRFVRPLLGMRRRVLQERMTAWGRTWREDASNQDGTIPRNRVRHTLLPALCRELNPGAVEHLAAFADQVRALDAWASEETLRSMNTCWGPEGLDLTAWRRAPEVLRERMVLEAMIRWGADPQKLTRAAVERLARVWTVPETETRRHREAGLALLRTGGRVLPEPSPLREAEAVPLVCGEPLLWSPLGRVLSCTHTDSFDPGASAESAWTGDLTAFCRAGSFRVREPRRGDRYRPLGLQGTAKLSDLLGGAKIPLPQRRAWPVVVCGEEIVWVPGFRVAEDWKAGDGAVLRLEFHRGD